MDSTLLVGLLILTVLILFAGFRAGSAPRDSFGPARRERYFTIPPPPGGWPAARAPGPDTPLYGGTVPGWGVSA